MSATDSAIVPVHAFDLLTRAPGFRAGIDAISLNPDVVDRTRRLVAAAEQRLLLKRARTGG